VGVEDGGLGVFGPFDEATLRALETASSSEALMRTLGRTGRRGSEFVGREGLDRVFVQTWSSGGTTGRKLRRLCMPGPHPSQSARQGQVFRSALGWM